MATNNYFQRGQGVGRSSEQDQVEQIIIEMIKMAGSDFYYIKRDLVNTDPLFNEDSLSKFKDYAIIEMYVQNAASYGGQGHLIGKMGLDVADSLELIVSKKRSFEETGIDVPNAGDLIYWPMTKSLWQINYVDSEMTPFYTLSNLYTFSLKCSRFIYGYENFDTGVKGIDDINNYNTPFEKNDSIINEAQDDTDFSESNPFGELPPDSNGE